MVKVEVSTNKGKTWKQIFNQAGQVRINGEVVYPKPKPVKLSSYTSSSYTARSFTVP